ncbi:MAG TPA: shikimate kinase [Zeimonas sp.]
MNESPPTHAPPDARPLVLVGMMGAGKSTVGRRLAARLNRHFVDADRALEARCGVPIATIFELEGEAGFRRRERAMLDELLALPDVVLATGGGVVLDDGNRRLLRERGWVVYLKAAAPELWHRLRRDRTRPLLQTGNPRERIAQLLAQREPLYDAVAHCTVPSAHQPVDELVEHIIDALPESLRPAR